MSGVVGPAWVDVCVGLGADLAWKTAIPLAMGLALSWLPGTSAAKHLRLVVGCATVPVVVVSTVLGRSDAAVWTDAPVWPLVAWAVVAGLGMAGMLRALSTISRLKTAPLTAGVECSDQLGSPITVGWLAPRIIVPTDFSRWTPLAQRAALLHERAHIARRDWLVHMAVWALTVVLWFNPLMWWTRQRMALLAECAADDHVLRGGVEPSVYASQLLALARSGPRAALAMSASPVGRRIHAVLDERSRSGASTLPAVGLAVVVVTAGVQVSAVEAWQPPPVVHGCVPSDAGAALLPGSIQPFLFDLPYLDSGE